MEFDISLRMTVQHPTKGDLAVCFRHAVELALKGHTVNQDIEQDVGGEYDLRYSNCCRCVASVDHVDDQYKWSD